MQNKSDLFEPDLIEIANLAKALAHPARIKIIQILTQKNACITGELVELMPLAQSTVSQHLLELKKAGLIRGEIEGPKTCYCLNPEMLTRARQIMTEFFELFMKGKNNG